MNTKNEYTERANEKKKLTSKNDYVQVIGLYMAICVEGSYRPRTNTNANISTRRERIAARNCRRSDK